MLNMRPMRSATFRQLTAAYWVNEFGTLTGQVALAILVYDRTHSPLGSAALFTTLRSLPAALSPLLTARIDTARPRVVLATLYLLEAQLFAAIALLTRDFSLLPVLALSAIDGCLAVTAKALIRSASAALLLEKGLLREGNAILNLGLMASVVGAPLLAGGMVAWKGAEWALLVDAATFVVTALIILSARGIRVDTDEVAGWAARLRNGLGVLRTHTAVRRLMVAVAVIVLMGDIPIPIEVVFAKHTLSAGDSGYGLLLGAWGVGMVIGAAIYAAVSDVRLIVVIGLGTLMGAVGYGGLAAAPTIAVACAASAVGGLGNGGAWIATITAVQERIPADTQSAIMSVLEATAQIMSAFGFAIGGALTVAVSPRLAYAFAAVGVAAVVGVVALRPIDQVPLSPVDSQQPQLDLAAERAGRQAEASAGSHRIASLSS